MFREIIIPFRTLIRISAPEEESVGANPKTAEGIGRRDFIKRTGLAVAGLTTASTLLTPVRRGTAAGTNVTEITFSSAKFFGKETIAEVVQAFNGSQDKIHVTYKELPPPSSSTEVHQGLVQQLARRNGDPDVFTQDIIWIAEFAAAKWALPLDEYFNAEVMKEYFPGVVQACTWQGKLTALPWFIDSGMLYYRKDLLDELGAKSPETWSELVESAKKLTGSGKAKFGFLWQAKQAEVLVCDLVSFVGSNDGVHPATGRQNGIHCGRCCGRSRSADARPDQKVSRSLRKTC